MHLKPGHVIDIGDREGIVLFNSTIKEKECIVVTFEDKKEIEYQYYEVLERNNNITVKKLEDEEIISELLIQVTDKVLKNN